jgi:hypothetical protein
VSNPFLASPRLVVFDDVDKLAMVSEYFPKPPKGSGSAIIITTRNPAVITGASTIEMPPLTYEESVDFLQYQANPSTSTVHKDRS